MLSSSRRTASRGACSRSLRAYRGARLLAGDQQEPVVGFARADRSVLGRRHFHLECRRERRDHGAFRDREVRECELNVTDSRRVLARRGPNRCEENRLDEKAQPVGYAILEREGQVVFLAARRRLELEDALSLEPSRGNLTGGFRLERLTGKDDRERHHQRRSEEHNR